MGKFDKTTGKCSAICWNAFEIRGIKFEACCKSRRKKPGICMHIMVEGGRFDQPSRNKGEIRADPKSKLILPFCRVLITAQRRSLQQIVDPPLSLMQNRLPSGPARRKRNSPLLSKHWITTMESVFPRDKTQEHVVSLFRRSCNKGPAEFRVFTRTSASNSHPVSSISASRRRRTTTTSAYLALCFTTTKKSRRISSILHRNIDLNLAEEFTARIF